MIKRATKESCGSRQGRFFLSFQYFPLFHTLCSENGLNSGSDLLCLLFLLKLILATQLSVVSFAFITLKYLLHVTKDRWRINQDIMCHRTSVHAPNSFCVWSIYCWIMFESQAAWVLWHLTILISVCGRMCGVKSAVSVLTFYLINASAPSNEAVLWKVFFHVPVNATCQWCL